MNILYTLHHPATISFSHKLKKNTDSTLAIQMEIIGSCLWVTNRQQEVTFTNMF